MEHTKFKAATKVKDTRQNLKKRRSPFSANLVTNILYYFTPHEIYCSSMRLWLIDSKFNKACKAVLPNMWQSQIRVQEVIKYLEYKIAEIIPYIEHVKAAFD